MKIEGKREILFGMILSVEATDGGDWRRDEPPPAIMLTVVESETPSGTDIAWRLSLTDRRDNHTLSMMLSVAESETSSGTDGACDCH